MSSKREVTDRSGHCSSGAGHATCHRQWETPSAIVTCSCPCHARAVVVKKVVRKMPPKVSSGVVVKKR